MVIRGAPAIGVAAAMGMALGVRHSSAETIAELRAEFERIAETISTTRPTAVNLFWAVKRMRAVLEELLVLPRFRTREDRGGESRGWRKGKTHPGRRYRHQSGDGPARCGPAAGSGTVLTHCNAGALATGGYGTALGVIRAAVAAREDASTSSRTKRAPFCRARG